MKKILLILSALLLTAVGASAQVTDVTATYIKNASFETSDTLELTFDSTRGITRGEDESATYTGAYSITVDELLTTGWTLTNAPSVCDIMTADASATDNTFGAPGAPSNGVQMLYLRDSWQTNKEVSLSQSVTLPAGDYALTVDTKCISSTSSTGTLVVGNASAALTIHTSNVPDNWDTAEVTFTLAEETEVSFGVNIIFNGGEGSFLIDNFKLYSIGDFDNDVTWALANPSFEVDKVVANLTVDGKSGYAVTSLTGWDLVIPTNTDDPTRAVADLMTKDATATDDNYGLPGTPNDGTYMLYLRNSWASNVASVKQTVTLPAGDYKLTVDNKCASSETGTSKKVTLLAGNVSKTLTIGTPQGTETTASTVQMLADWTTSDLEFSVEEDGEVTLGVEVTFDGHPGLSVLLDNFKLYAGEAITESVSWTMTEAGWGTMILPFAATLEDGLTAYSCDGTTTDEDTETTTVDLTEVGQSITANTPYIIKCTDDNAIKAHSFSGTPTNTADTYTEGLLTGTLVNLAVAKGAAFATDGTQYLLQNQEEVDGVAFYPIVATESADATLDAYHCYLTVTAEDSDEGEPAKLSIVLPGSGEATAIVAVESDVIADDAIYDLSGRRVAKAVKGVYIQNGKKVLVK